MTEKEAMEETLARMDGAEAALTETMTKYTTYDDNYWRLMHKREGLRLGKSYLEEGLRLID